MNLCERCGQEVNWITRDDRRIPIHPNGGCVGGSSSGVAVTKIDRWNYTGEVRPTSCPICGASPIFFIRHNGGCAWFECLGQPWTKHPCFDTEDRAGVARPDANCTRELFDAITSEHESKDVKLLGIVAEIASKAGSMSIITLQGDHIFARTFSDQLTLIRVGDLVKINTKEKTVSLLMNPNWFLGQGLHSLVRCEHIEHVVFRVGTRYWLDYDQVVHLVKMEPHGMDKILTVVSVKNPKVKMTFKATSWRVLP